MQGNAARRVQPNASIMKTGLTIRSAPLSVEVREKDAEDECESVLVCPDLSEGDKKWKGNVPLK